MTALAMREAAEAQIAMVGEDALVALKVPGRWGKRNKRRIWPGGPVGTIVSEEHDGRLVVLLSARALLDALAEVEARDKEGA